jgi:hypothetical protein
MDWNSKITKKHIKEATAVGLTLLGEGKSQAYRIYKCNICDHHQEIQFGAVRRNTFRCENCFQTKLKQEAKAVGLKLIGKGKRTAKSVYRTYQFDDCGHEIEAEVGNVRKHKPRCPICFEQKLEEEALNSGLVSLGEGKSAAYRKYKFIECQHIKEFKVGHVRDGNIKCSECIEAKLEKEAKSAGLIIIGIGRKLGYRNYKFIQCGHQQEIRTGHVREKGFRCNQCFLDKINRDAKEAGLSLIGVGRSSKKEIYRLYRFDNCGHEKEISLKNVREGSFKCDICFDSKVNDEAISVGLKIIGKGSRRAYRLYEFEECSHRIELRISHVRDKNFKCKICKQNKITSEAESNNLTIIGEGRNPNYRLYRFNKCNHIQEITLSSVRQKSFICNTCEETSRDLPSKVYLLKIQSGSFIWLKLGYAKTVKTRMKQYRLPEDAKVKRLKVIDFDSGREAHKFESKLHTKYKRKRLPIRKMKEFHKDGFNECYPLEMLDTLLEELEST